MSSDDKPESAEHGSGPPDRGGGPADRLRQFQEARGLDADEDLPAQPDDDEEDRPEKDRRGPDGEKDGDGDA